MAAKAGELREVPGPRAKKIIELDKNYGATSTQDYGFVPAGGRGVHLFDPDGNEYIDFTCGGGVTSLGHGNAAVARAARYQRNTGLTQLDANVWPNPPSVDLKKRLAKLAAERFSGGYKVFLCSSGTEAVEAAVKLLLDNRPERTSFISFEMAFHGRTGYAIPLMGGKEVHHRGFPKAYNVHHFPYPYCWRCAYQKYQSTCDEFCINFIEEEFQTIISPKEINAFFIELVQGEGGVNVPNPKAVQKLSELCKKHGILIVADEVQTGMGRTGTMFACEQFDICPDVLTLAKALSNGEAPAGAAVFRAELDFKEKGRHSNTNGGNAVACAAALAVINELQSGAIVNGRRSAGIIMGKLELIVNHFNNKQKEERRFVGFLGCPRGLGLMIGIEVVKNLFFKEPFPEFRDKIKEECLKRGLLLMDAGNPKKNPVLRFLPPLTITEDEVNKAMEIFEEGLKAAFGFIQ